MPAGQVFPFHLCDLRALCGLLLGDQPRRPRARSSPTHRRARARTLPCATVTQDLLLFGVGLAALYFGAEWLVRGAARFARARGVSALAVGLTIVAFGTSSPELVVSTIAAARGQDDVALGNVIGSNILNVGGVLGLAALIRPLRVGMRLLRREAPLLVLVSVAFGWLAWDGWIGRIDALLLLTGFAGYLAFVLGAARREAAGIEAEFDEFEAEEALAPRGERGWVDVALMAAGLATLALGAHALVTGAVGLARAFGVSELVIGLTIIAIGTSLPELATTALAAARREADIAVGNIVGSSLFNLLCILGAASAVRPLRVAPGLLTFEIPVMIAAAVLLLPFAWTRLRLERWEGALLLAGYLAFQGWLFWGPSAG